MSKTNVSNAASNIVSTFTHGWSIGHNLALKRKRKQFEALTQNSLPLFMRGGDTISLTPQVFGYHEIQIKKLIEHFASNGYFHFLIDIGANIGLISCQSGDKFDQVFMFEPNPDCFSIMKVNARIALSKPITHLYNFGLGEKSGEVILNIPKHNWGGAFVRDGGNSYSDELLAQKDAFSVFNDNNYEKVKIKLESAEQTFINVFSQLDQTSPLKGVIKIDVEGYESVVLDALAKTLPKNFDVVVIFESWEQQYDVDALARKFGQEACVYRLKKSPEKKWGIRGLFRLFTLLFGGGYNCRLMPALIGDSKGDLVLVTSRMG